MSNISIKLNLGAFKCGIQNITGKSGIPKKCLIIPIEDNHLITGEKGVYADLIAWPIKEKRNDSKDTHLIKQSFKKEYLDSLTDMQKNALPIFGNLVDWSKNVSVNQAEDFIDPVKMEEPDDLPF